MEIAMRQGTHRPVIGVGPVEEEAVLVDLQGDRDARAAVLRERNQQVTKGSVRKHI